MIKFVKNFSHTLIILASITQVSAFGDYLDDSGQRISFEVIDQVAALPSHKFYFIQAKDHAFRNLKPWDIDPVFRTREDVTTWLSKAFDQEEKNFVHADHPMKWITILKNGKNIGFALFEQWQDNKYAWQIKHMAIVPSEQSKGHEDKLVFSLFHLVDNTEKLVIDVHQSNAYELDVYKHLGFVTQSDSGDQAPLSDLYQRLCWSRT